MSRLTEPYSSFKAPLVGTYCLPKTHFQSKWSPPVWLRNCIAVVAHGPVSTSRDALVLPVCFVNQWFPREACLKLFKFSARSLEGNLKSADKWLHLPLPPLSHCMLQLTHSLTSCGQIPLSTLSGISMYRSIWLEYYSLSQRYLENTGASAVCLLPKHPAAACLIWRVITALLILIHPQQRCTLIKDSFKFKARPKPQATHTSPKGSGSVWSLFFPYKCRKCCTNLSEGAVSCNKGTDDDFECHACLNEYLKEYSCNVPAWYL